MLAISSKNDSALSFVLRTSTPRDWAPRILENFDAFLIDHSAAERKASATALQFVLHYPDRDFLIDPMIRHAREELAHYHDVSKIMLKRGLRFHADSRSPYVQGLLEAVRNGRDTRFLDRLLVAAIAEARGHERFGLLAEALEEADLKNFYARLTEAEERHHHVFMEIALHYFDVAEVNVRLQELLDLEGTILKGLAFRAAVY